MVEGSDEAPELAEAIGTAAQAGGRSVAVAESLTGGALSAAPVSAPEAGEWYAGGVTAYRIGTKRRILGVQADRVVTPECAAEMAGGVRRLLGVDISAALTGVGGPGAQEGQPPGTVHIAIATAEGERTFPHRFEGSPEEIVSAAVRQALRHLRDELARITA